MRFSYDATPRHEHLTVSPLRHTQKMPPVSTGTRNTNLTIPDRQRDDARSQERSIQFTSDAILSGAQQTTRRITSRVATDVAFIGETLAAGRATQLHRRLRPTVRPANGSTYGDAEESR
ncbi:hypothetical protein BIW11_10586 [Tropilaelaps mercedesae]|uniref:Uncharacterized protein n=1 Tax=Tropilaelaps mercedesae TaxID=418985 RepID=A0A1V9XEW5_9ACAR|nr:hypothetical protein BIW11_10586 [Tropilaelaps mercedesae]